MINKTFSDNFNDKWLFESPMATGPASHNPYDDLAYAVKINIENGNTPVNLNNSLKKLNTNDDVFYWVETKGKIDIISQMQEKQAWLFVELTGKSKDSMIYASDFYEMILKDAKRLIFSGNMLSDEGLGIWKQLLKHGKNIFLYDTSNPLNRESIDTEEDLIKFMGSSIDYKKYRYVLSESIKEHTSTITSFNLLRTYNLTFGIK
jgi:hypothetical protein